MAAWFTLMRHRWCDSRDTRRRIPDDMAERLSARIGASEARHTGQVRICVEAALPTDLLWRQGPRCTLAPLVRERALFWFGQLGVWDTEHNNGVLIYLLLAEQAIEFVADRALARHVPPEQWQAAVDHLRLHLKAGDFETGLTQALGEVSALLVAHFPAHAGQPSANELPNIIVRV